MHSMPLHFVRPPLAPWPHVHKLSSAMAVLSPGAPMCATSSGSTPDSASTSRGDAVPPVRLLCSASRQRRRSSREDEGEEADEMEAGVGVGEESGEAGGGASGLDEGRSARAARSICKARRREEAGRMSKLVGQEVLPWGWGSRACGDMGHGFLGNEASRN